MIGYAIWDHTHLISNKFLRQYIRDTFYEIKLDFREVMVDHDLEILIGMYDDTYTHLVIFESGHTSRNPRAFRTAIERFCAANDFLVAGQIIHHVNTYPWLHPQMIVLNLQRYREFGCPMVGYHEESDVLELHRPERSPDNLHDDYTPLWLKPSEEVVSCMRRDFCWNLINESLNHGVPVLNLPNDVRWSKRYLYPTDCQHQFAACLEKLSQDQLVAIPTRMNPNQQKFLAELMTPGLDIASYLFNTERLTESFPAQRPVAKRLFGTASGFKLPIMWHQLGETADVVYFDYSRKSLGMWQAIVEQWSGENFQGFCESHGYKDDFAQMHIVFGALGGEASFQEMWMRFKASQPRFVYCDILKDLQPLIDQMIPDGNYVWYSNCFKFFEGIRRYGIAGSNQKEQLFLNSLIARASDTFCVGGNRLGLASDLAR